MRSMMPTTILTSGPIVTLGDDRPAAVAERPVIGSAGPIMPNGHICPKIPERRLTHRRRLS
jgi:hypothetical protein